MPVTISVAIATISRDFWDSIKSILTNDSSVKVNGTLGVNGIYGAYPQAFLDDASGLPFIVIHKPEIEETWLTMTKKKYPVKVLIETLTDSAESVKDIEDGIRNALQTNMTNTRPQGIFKFTVTGATEDFETRSNKRIHKSSLTYTSVWRSA